MMVFCVFIFGGNVGKCVWCVAYFPHFLSNTRNVLPLALCYFQFHYLGIISAGMAKLTKGNHDISGVKLRVTEGQMPSQSQLQQAIIFPSTPASQLMQPPPHVLPQQVTQSMPPVPVPRPRTKKPTSSLSTDEASVLSATAQGLSLATATGGQSFTQAEDSTTEIGWPDTIPVDVGSPAQSTSTSITSLSTPLRTSSIMSESLTPMSPVVRVVGIPPDWDEDMLNMAFDDEDEGGGEIEENGIQIKGDEALITFKDPDGKCDFPNHCELHQTA